MSEADDTLNQLKKQMEQFAQQMAEAQELLAPLNDYELKLNAAEHQVKETYKQQMEKINEKKALLHTKKQAATNNLLAIQQQANHANAQIKKIEQELEQKKAEEAAAKAEAEKFVALTENFDQATMAAPWREWAKNHQIQAGHKITMDRYVILADPMGLGKTLSSIITADMAEKVTKEASPDFPFLGEEKERLVPAHLAWTDKAESAAANREWPFNMDRWEPYLTFTELGAVWKDNLVEKDGPIPGYISYDERMRLINEGIAYMTESYYEKYIDNSIERPVGRKILYFCPSPLLRNVMEEWRRWAPHRNVTYIGNLSKLERNFVFETLPQMQQYVIIVNYEAWRRDKALLDRLASCKFDTVIIDEAHNIKDMKSQAFKGVKQVVDALKPEYIIPMTGTPILNRPQEIFPLLNIILPLEFTHERDFLFRYCEEYIPENSESGAPRWRFKPGGLEALTKKLSRHILRRTKEMAGIQLPEKTIIYHELDLDKENYPNQARARSQMKKFATLVIDEKAGKALQATVMIALITRLRQIETWPAGIVQRDKNTKEIILQVDIEESQKIDYIIRKENDDWEGLIPDTVEDERIVVFSQFKAPLHEIKRRVEAAGLRAVILDGDTPSTLRDEIRHDFDRSVTPNREDSKWDVLLANYKAAGVGLNLTNATQLITLDEEWNPGKRDQAWDRIHRIGQTHNVTINVIRTKDTVDTWMGGIISEKEEVTTGFEGAATNISKDDFLEFLKDDDEDSGLA